MSHKEAKVYAKVIHTEEGIPFPFENGDKVGALEFAVFLAKLCAEEDIQLMREDAAALAENGDIVIVKPSELEIGGSPGPWKVRIELWWSGTNLDMCSEKEGNTLQHIVDVKAELISRIWAEYYIGKVEPGEVDAYIKRDPEATHAVAHILTTHK